MSNLEQTLPTPTTGNMFSLYDNQRTNKEPVKNPNYTYTPCTRLSRMTIDSQSNGINGRIRTAHLQSPATNFNDKMTEALREEEEEESHPNLSMILGGDRISMFDKSKDNQYSFSEDEDSSDEGDLFSSSLCPMSSPDHNETIITRRNLFDEDNEDINVETPDENNFYDNTNSWLSCIYHDPVSSSSGSNSCSSSSSYNQHIDDEQEVDDENRPPRFWHNNKHQSFEKKTRRTVPHEEDNTVQERIPLREIHLEDYLSDNDDVPAKKKMILSNGKPRKMRFMRTLSPPRFASKRKGNL